MTVREGKGLTGRTPEAMAAARLEVATALAGGSSDLREFDRLAPERDRNPKSITATLVRGNSHVIRYAGGALEFRRNEPVMVSQRELEHLRRHATEKDRQIDHEAGVVRIKTLQRFSFAVGGQVVPDPPVKTVTRPHPLGPTRIRRRR